MMRSLLFANWKMNLPEESFQEFVAAMRDLPPAIEVAIAPPFPFLSEVREAIGSADIALGAQNCAEKGSGAFTGEVAPSMIRRAGGRYVIIGHSERRTLFGETDEVIGRKIRQAVNDGLAPVWCVGEDEKTREAGVAEVLLETQLRGGAAAAGELPAELVIAYEPVWAIGTGKTATPEIAADAHRIIRRTMSQLRPGLTLRILYGGSVTPENAASLSAQEEINGFLVGGASLTSRKFKPIGAALAAAAGSTKKVD